MKRFSLLVLMLSSFLTSSPAVAYEWEFFAPMRWHHERDVEIANNMVYVSTYGSGIQIVSMDDLNNLDPVGYFNVPGRATNSIAVQENNLFVDINSGLYVLDVQDPTNPQVLEIYDHILPGEVEVIDTVMFTYSYPSIKIYDITNIYDIQLVSEIQAHHIYQMRTHYCGADPDTGWVLFVAGLDGGLSLFSLDSLTEPELLCTLPTEMRVESISVDDTLLAFTFFNQLHLYDISNPAEPDCLWGLNRGRGGVALTHNLLYFAEAVPVLGGFRGGYFDISDPSNPVLEDHPIVYKGRVAGSNDSVVVVVNNQSIWTSYGEARIHIRTLSPMDTSVTHDYDPYFHDIAAFDDKVIVSAGYKGWQLWQENPGNNPTKITEGDRGEDDDDPEVKAFSFRDPYFGYVRDNVLKMYSAENDTPQLCMELDDQEYERIEFVDDDLVLLTTNTQIGIAAFIVVPEIVPTRVLQLTFSGHSNRP